MPNKTAIENEIKRRVYRTFWGYLIAWVIIGGCFSVANVDSPASSQSHLQVTSEAVVLSGLLGGLFYGVLLGLPTAFAMAIVERWKLRGYNATVFQIIWAVLVVVSVLASNHDLGWVGYLLLAVFYGVFIATIVFNNAMKKRYADDLKKHKATKSLILQEREEEAEKANKSPKTEPTDEPDDDAEDML
ncbi:hypothetical protein IJI72_02335 [Candidatus Saccharibacteria bacterium]|nr:hypothetical protein [Candidatus Saccharibacteria bacterium]